MNICVYCSSSNLIPEKHFKAARSLGIWLAKNGHSIVYGGANIGLMEALAASFKEHDPTGKLIGVIPDKIIDMGYTTQLADQIIRVHDMKERKEAMRQMGEGYIALAGSFGTLDEIIEEIVLHQLNYHQKPLIFFDPNNFYEFLYKQFDKFFEEKFIDERFRNIYTVVRETEDLGQFFD